MSEPFPGRITAIEAQSRVRKYLGTRVNISVDDKFSFAIDAELALKRELRIGRVLSQSELSQLLREDGEAKAFARALHFLSYRARSTQEVRDRLKRDEWPEEIIDRVIARLIKSKFISDESFAALWVENRSLYRPRGAYALRQELRQKGVGREEIEAALPDAESESDNALAALKGKLRSFERFEGREREQKMLGFLQRRGFNYSVAKVAMKRLEEDE